MLTQDDFQQIKGIVNGVVQEETRKIVQEVVQEETRKIVREEARIIVKEELKPINKTVKKIQKDLNLVINHFDTRISKNSKDILKLQEHVGIAIQ